MKNHNYTCYKANFFNLTHFNTSHSVKFNNCSCILIIMMFRLIFEFGFVFYNAPVTSFELEGGFICSVKDSIQVAQLDILSA